VAGEARCQDHVLPGVFGGTCERLLQEWTDVVSLTATIHEGPLLDATSCDRLLLRPRESASCVANAHIAGSSERGGIETHLQ
jgi:hypothetical protein